MSDAVLIAAVLLVLVLIYALMRVMKPDRPEPKVPRTRRTTPTTPLDPDKFIVVDGSNVMHWGGEPLAFVLNQVLVALDKKGLIPIIYFDANVGYKLWGRYADAQTIAPKIGVKPHRVNVVPSGVVADEVLLSFAVESGIRVVTNDRFLDWRVQYPRAAEKGFLVKGTWREGSVMLRGV